MVWTNISKYCHIWPKNLNVVKLKTTDFQYVYFKIILCHLFGKTDSNIASQAYMVLVFFKQMINQRGCCCFTIASSYSNNFC